MFRSFILLLLCVAATATDATTPKTGHKILIFAPGISNSQIVYNKRVSEVLAKAGNDVTMLLLHPFTDIDDSVKIDPIVKVKHVNASTGINKDAMKLKETIFEDLPMWDKRMINQITKFGKLFSTFCTKMVGNKELLDWIKAEKFDIAFTHVYHTCPIGIIHHTGIPSWIWLNSGMLMDFVAQAVGVPIIPSYIPPIVMEAHDSMTFVERTKSVIGHGLQKLLYRHFSTDKETVIFRELLDPNFPDIYDLARQCPLVMVNSNDLYQLPRPSLAKVINVGGIGMLKKDAKPLPAELDALANKSEGVIIMSFGSVAPAHDMPQAWKEALMKAFAKFPKYLFVIRYEKEDLDAIAPPNVKIMKWMPQKDLLQHPKTKIFISHGGYNSMQETISAGKPMIAIALFGDQPKNSMIAQKHGFAVVLKKSEMTDSENIATAINTILTDDNYANKAKRLGSMVDNQPISPDQLLIQWTKFTATYKTLENLVPAGQHLNFIEYHSLDVYLFLLSIVLVILLVLKKIVKVTLCFICRKFGKCDKVTESKEKKEQ